MPERDANQLAADVSAVEKFWSRVDRSVGPESCWLWLGPRNGKWQYGNFHDSRLTPPRWRAHRFAYELLVGPIPEGLTLDHLCFNTLCVNPKHLEPVTMRENLMRGNGFSAKAARATHCPQGHPYDEANTRITPQGWRACRECARTKWRARYYRRKAQA